ncbi:MAG: type II toxin-antitoxin system RelE/ParE family toxin [Melioribacteraceae bacterium]|nr:type II toxin-antitoxin system RelE/ParE family toxin [Melioribacteraceae bacterium]
MFKLSFRPSASNDVQEIVNYYDKLEIRLTDVFLKELEDTLKHINSMPESCQKKLGDIRVSYLKRFKFGIYFKIYKKTIVVIAVLHTSRDPQIWQSR